MRHLSEKLQVNLPGKLEKGVLNDTAACMHFKIEFNFLITIY